MRHFIRVTFWVKQYQKPDGGFYTRIHDNAIRGAVPIETVWHDEQLVDWNLTGNAPTKANLDRMPDFYVWHIKQLLAKADCYPPMLWGSAQPIE